MHYYKALYIVRTPFVIMAHLTELFSKDKVLDLFILKAFVEKELTVTQKIKYFK